MVSTKPNRNAIIANEAFRNARHLLRSADRLAEARSYGHASSLVVLAVEEAAKGLAYHLAANQIIRFVRGKGNGITTLNERDLLVHNVKQGIVTGAILEVLQFLPLYQAAEKAPLFKTKEDFRRYIQQVIFAQVEYWMEVRRPGSYLGKQIFKHLSLLDQLSLRKNRGLYVDVYGAKVLAPRHIPKRSYDEVRELAGDLVEGLATVSSAPVSEGDRALIVKHRRWIASRMKLVQDVVIRTKAGKRNRRGPSRPRDQPSTPLSSTK